MSSVIFTAEGPMLNALLLQHSTLFRQRRSCVRLGVWHFKIPHNQHQNCYQAPLCIPQSHKTGSGDIKHQTETLIDVSEWVMSASHGGFWQSSIQNLSELVINYDGEGRTARGRARETAALPRQRNKWLVCFYNSICCCSNMHVLIAATEAMQPIHGTFASVSGPL